MCMFIRIPAAMKSRPPTVNAQPKMDLPFTKSVPMPKSSGSRLIPKLLPNTPKPLGCPNVVCTYTWLARR